MARSRTTVARAAAAYNGDGGDHMRRHVHVRRQRVIDHRHACDGRWAGDREGRKVASEGVVARACEG